MGEGGEFTMMGRRSIQKREGMRKNIGRIRRQGSISTFQTIHKAKIGTMDYQYVGPSTSLNSM